MALKAVKGIAPSSWASYLVNGDASSFDLDPDEGTAEKAKADAFAAYMGGPIVSCEDAGFCWAHDASRFGVKGADCQTYTALVKAA